MFTITSYYFYFYYFYFYYFFFIEATLGQYTGLPTKDKTSNTTLQEFFFYIHGLQHMSTLSSTPRHWGQFRRCTPTPSCEDLNPSLPWIKWRDQVSSSSVSYSSYNEYNWAYPGSIQGLCEAGLEVMLNLWSNSLFPKALDPRPSPGREEWGPWSPHTLRWSKQ